MTVWLGKQQATALWRWDKSGRTGSGGCQTLYSQEGFIQPTGLKWASRADTSHK